MRQERVIDMINPYSIIEKKNFEPSYYGAIAIRAQIKNQDISNLIYRVRTRMKLHGK